MSVDTLAKEAMKLSEFERIELLKLLANSLTGQTEEVSADILEELKRRNADKSPLISAKDVKAKLKKKYGL